MSFTEQDTQKFQSESTPQSRQKPSPVRPLGSLLEPKASSIDEGEEETVADTDTPQPDPDDIPPGIFH